MRFWDTSAIVPLGFDETDPGSPHALLREDEGIVTWWGTAVECASAAARLRRERRIDRSGEAGLLGMVDRLRAGWLEIEPSEALRRRAMHLLRVHTLRAGDALQLAAAGMWAGSDPGRAFVTLDRRLADAARAEGFDVLIPTV